MNENKESSRLLTFSGPVYLFAILLFPITTFASGAVGPPGLLEAYLLVLAGIGFIPVLLLIFAFSSRASGRSVAIKTRMLLIPVYFYAPVAFSCFFVASNNFSSKLTGVIGGLMMLALFVFDRPRNIFLFRSLLFVFSATLLVLVTLPNQYWEGPTLSFQKIELVNNLPKRNIEQVLQSNLPGGLIALENGRHIFQSKYLDGRDVSPTTNFSTSLAVSLEPLPIVDGVLRFEVTHYYNGQNLMEYHQNARTKFLIPFSTRYIDQYREGASKFVGEIVGPTTQLNFKDLFLNVIAEPYGWEASTQERTIANYRYWTSTLVQLGELAIDSTSLSTRALSVAHCNAIQPLVASGLKADATNGSGDSVLHIAVNCGNVELFQWLLEQGIDAAMVNRRGQDGFQYLLENRPDLQQFINELSSRYLPEN
ncbi:MAG: hypothetical protein GKR91_19550 [Pseudomonadales bacterium]|nr:hypothetical protein [Pseudomonadales bacterium]